MELHGHFPWYGLYVHPTDTWEGHHESGPMSYDSVRRYIDLANKHGIALHIYYNTIDGQIPYVAKEFPESVVRDEDGKIVPAFTDCYLMNADPRCRSASTAWNSSRNCSVRIPTSTACSTTCTAGTTTWTSATTTA